MATDETRIALIEERVGFLIQRESSHHERIHEVEDTAGKTDIQLVIVKEKVNRHEKIIIGNGEEGLTEQVRGLRLDVAEMKNDLKTELAKKEKRNDQGRDRGWQISVAIVLLILKEIISWWITSQPIAP